MRQRLWTPLLIAIVTLSLAGCASDKGPAELAIKAAEDAVASVKGEAAQYVPDQLKSVEDGIAALKESFGKGDYKAVLAAAPDLTAKARALGDLAKTKKEEMAAMAAKTAELTKTWTDMAEGLPKMVGALESRVNILSKARTLPAKISKETFEEAKTGLAAVKQTWTEAEEAFKGGKVEDAVAKANEVKAKTAEIMTKLGMQVPAAAEKG
jgi:hypothetical protein